MPKTAAAGVGTMSMNGVTGVVTITGSGFGHSSNGKKPSGEHARVRFRNFVDFKTGWINPFEGDYISWADDEIVVKVPSNGYKDDTKIPITNPNIEIACSGEVQVCIEQGDDCCKSAGNLYIPFSARNQDVVRANGCRESIPTILGNMNDVGGYTFYFRKGFYNPSPNWQNRRQIFRRSLSEWRCNTLVNFDVRDDTTGVFLGRVGNCTIQIDSIMTDTGTVSTSKGETSLNDNPCNSLNTNHYQLYRGDIFINHFVPGRGDTVLQATILHEIGHVHLLNHTCNAPFNVMTGGNFSNPIELAPDDISGGVHETLLGATTSDPFCLKDTMHQINAGECYVPIFETEEKKFSVNVFPNPASSNVVVEIEDLEKGNILIFNTLGIEVFRTQISTQNQVDISTFSRGLYFIAIRLNSGEVITVGKIQKI